MRRFLLLLLLGPLLAFAQTAKDALEFSAVLITGGEARVVLIDHTANTTSRWLRHGDTFAGYEIGDYDRAHDVLTLLSANQRFTIGLRESVVKPGGEKLLDTIPGVLKLQIGIDGKLQVGGAEVSMASLRTLFNRYAANDQPLHIELMLPVPTPEQAKNLGGQPPQIQAMEKMQNEIREAGVKKATLNMNTVKGE